MGKFGGSGTFEGDGAYRQMIAKVQDIKASPHHGQKRLVVMENGKTSTHSVIDIDMRAGREIEEKGTYVFNVCEKEESRYGYQRKKNTRFSAYHCDSAPSEFTPATENAMRFSRFSGDICGSTGRGGKGGSSPASRTRF